MKTAAKVYQFYPDSNSLASFTDRISGRNVERFIRENNRKFIKEFAKNNYKDNNITVKWDRKLGCSCGCSPGFRIMTSNGKYYPDEFCTKDVLTNVSGIVGI